MYFKLNHKETAIETVKPGKLQFPTHLLYLPKQAFLAMQTQRSCAIFMLYICFTYNSV